MENPSTPSPGSAAPRTPLASAVAELSRGLDLADLSRRSGVRLLELERLRRIPGLAGSGEVLADAAAALAAAHGLALVPRLGARSPGRASPGPVPEADPRAGVGLARAARARAARRLEDLVGVGQGELARRVGLTAGLVRRLRDPGSNLHLASVERLLGALGAGLDLVRAERAEAVLEATLAELGERDEAARAGRARGFVLEESLGRVASACGIPLGGSLPFPSAIVLAASRGLVPIVVGHAAAATANLATLSRLRDGSLPAPAPLRPSEVADRATAVGAMVRARRLAGSPRRPWSDRPRGDAAFRDLVEGATGATSLARLQAYLRVQALGLAFAPLDDEAPFAATTR